MVPLTRRRCAAWRSGWPHSAAAASTTRRRTPTSGCRRHPVPRGAGAARPPGTSSPCASPDPDLHRGRGWSRRARSRPARRGSSRPWSPAPGVPRLRRHRIRQDHPAGGPAVPRRARGAGRRGRGRQRAASRTTPTSSPSRGDRPTSRVQAQSTCARWCGRRCGCGPDRLVVGEVRGPRSSTCRGAQHRSRGWLRHAARELGARRPGQDRGAGPRRGSRSRRGAQPARLGGRRRAPPGARGRRGPATAPGGGAAASGRRSRADGVGSRRRRAGTRPRAGRRDAHREAGPVSGPGPGTGPASRSACAALAVWLLVRPRSGSGTAPASARAGWPALGAGGGLLPRLGACVLVVAAAAVGGLAPVASPSPTSRCARVAARVLRPVSWSPPSSPPVDHPAQLSSAPPRHGRCSPRSPRHSGRADVPDALRSLGDRVGSAGDLRVVAAAWQVAHRTGQGPGGGRRAGRDRAPVGGGDPPAGRGRARLGPGDRATGGRTARAGAVDGLRRRGDRGGPCSAPRVDSPAWRAVSPSGSPGCGGSRRSPPRWRGRDRDDLTTLTTLTTLRRGAGPLARRSAPWCSPVRPALPGRPASDDRPPVAGWLHRHRAPWSGLGSRALLFLGARGWWRPR